MTSRPWIGPRFLSLFSSGRPPLPWNLADRINETLQQNDIRSVGVTGSLCPSVITACGYGAPDREINAGSPHSRWDEGIQWNSVMDDSPGMEKDHPWGNLFLPVKVWFGEGLSRFFDSEALFIDLPFSHRNVGAEWFPALKRLEFKLIFLGFLEGYEGPADALATLKSLPFTTEEFVGTVKFSETGQELTYRLVVAKRIGEVTRKSSAELWEEEDRRFAEMKANT
jgi:hypothetical protein